MTTLAPSFLICSSLFMQVTRTTIKSRMGSKFSRIRPGTYELAAQSVWKNPHRLIMGECCDHSSTFILDGATSFLLTIRTAIKARTSLNFRKIP